MERFQIDAQPICKNIVLETDFLRISLLTSKLLRVETKNLTNLATQTVLFRDLGIVRYSVEQCKKYWTIRTDSAAFKVNINSGRVVRISLSDGTLVTNFTKGNLGGTARTLDTANGPIKLNDGILSRSGVSVMDDSTSLLLTVDGKILPRPDCSDKYYFAYGRDYQEQLRDFFRITGPVPLIPKYALGNWWSRYKAYTQEEYRALMQEFIDRQIPVTVATIDMDWHWTDVVRRFGNAAKAHKPNCKEEVLYNTWMHGWTGYSWNTELFPNHPELLQWLHDHGFKVTLNVHPSQGVRFFEDAYTAMCAKMHVDPSTKSFIPFNPTNIDYWQAYFDALHHPLEQEGVDFWWIDWQQGKHTSIPGLDPLWALNHYHTLDAASKDTRPLILSRYAGLGSHRYPLGFSGDTIVSWKSLDFQPYFTNTAANAGYTWWSHDIGGHMYGVQDDELYLRWLQYGVFSPINRLHSSNSDFMGKEPWKRNWAVNQIAEDFLRLRHKLIPYLYSCNFQTHKNGIPICSPIYYHHDCEEAYQVKNQYFFGSQLMVSPITKPCDKRLNLASVKTWLPHGRWTDIFNGRIYQGGRWVHLYRDLDSIPVLAREGAIIPMYQTGNTNDLSLDQPLDIHIWRGNGYFELYDDDGETKNHELGHHAITTFTLEEQDHTIRLTIVPPANVHHLLPPQRKINLIFRDIACDDIQVVLEDTPVIIELNSIRYKENVLRDTLRSHILTRVQGKNIWKRKRFSKNIPAFVQMALDEIDALWYPESK